MEFSWAEIKITDLLLSPAYYKITTRSEIDDLVEGIGAVGLLQPIWVYPENDKYSILAGHRRAAAVAAMGCDSITARIVPPATPLLQRAMIAIADNTCQRQLNLVEQSRALLLLKNAAEDEEKILELGRKVGLAFSKELVAKLEKIDAMIPALQDSLIDGKISLPMALKLGRLKQKAAAVLVELFTTMGIGLNRQRQVLTWIEEIALRDGIDIVDVLCRENIIPIPCDMEGRDKKSWTNSILKILRYQRYPALVKAENSFKDALQKLKMPSGMRIEPPAYFEGASYRVSLVVKNKQDLAEFGRSLERMAKTEDVDRVFQ